MQVRLVIKAMLWWPLAMENIWHGARPSLMLHDWYRFCCTTWQQLQSSLKGLLGLLGGNVVRVVQRVISAVDSAWHHASGRAMHPAAMLTRCVC